MRRLLSAAVAMTLAAGIVGAPKAATAATGCSKSWHYITHGETGLNLRPDPYLDQGNTTLYADAVPGTDVWNQQFLFGRDPDGKPATTRSFKPHRGILDRKRSGRPRFRGVAGDLRQGATVRDRSIRIIPANVLG